MSFIENLFYLICTSWVGLSAAGVFDDNHIIASTAIIDNGCSKPAKIELSQTKTNADVYNYAALSTSYKR